MIALVRKNFACLISNHSSFARKSDVSYLLSLHLLSTLRERVLVRVSDVLVNKHQFSPEVASLVASHLNEQRSPENADLMLSFLEESGFSSTQLQNIVIYKPRVLLRSVEDIKLKIKTLQDLGLSSEDIVKIICFNKMILHVSAKDKIIRSLSLLRGFLGSNYDVAKLLRKSGWFVLADLEKTLLPNVELLKSCGLTMDRIIFLLFCTPRCLLIKPEIMRKSIDKAKEMGFCHSSKMFIYAVREFAYMTKGMWEVKWQTLQDSGFSDDDILKMVKKCPQVLHVSSKKLVKIKELLLATGKFNMSSIVKNPSSLGCSIEKRYKPRLRILGVLESKNLIKKWPGLGIVYTLSDDKFFERFVRPYKNEIGDALVTKSCVKGAKCGNDCNSKGQIANSPFIESPPPPFKWSFNFPNSSGSSL